MINDKEAKEKDLIHVGNHGEEIEVEGLSNTRAIILAGEPLNEEVVSHGPFVMNNATQIMAAMRDYQMGKMGFLVEEFE